jgi:hypothetical protein
LNIGLSLVAGLALLPVALAVQSPAPSPSPEPPPPEDVAPRKVEVRSAPVPLNPDKPDQERIGRLRYRGGVHLTSDDKRFGGFSSMRLSHDGSRLTLVSDEGSWLTARIALENGRLRGIEDAEMGPLVDLDGTALREKDNRDAESLAILPDGSFLVGFERQHRIWHYGGDNGRLKGPPDAIPPPPGLAEAPFNGGIESLLSLGKGRLFAMTEYGIQGDLIRGWVGTPPDWRPLGYRFERALRPSDAALLPWGDLLVLERAYNPDRGIVGVRIRQIGRDALRPEAILGGRLVADIEPPLTLDNLEGIDCHRRDKETLCYVVSDDNLNPQQRTLLLLFGLEGR